MSTQLRWCRLWTDIIDDPKLLLLAPSDRWYYVALLTLKRNGMLDEPDSLELRDRKISIALRIEERDRDELKRRLMEVRLIDSDWQPSGWIKRQFNSDFDSTAAQRQRRHRKKARHAHVTRDSQAHVTGVSPGQIRADTDTDTEQKQNPRALGTNPRAVAAGLDESAWQRWFGYRRDIRKPIKPASILAAQQELAGFGSEQATVVQHSIANSYQGLFAPNGRATVSRPAVRTLQEVEAAERARATG